MLSTNIYWGFWWPVHIPSIFLLPVQVDKVLLQECCPMLCPSRRAGWNCLEPYPTGAANERRRWRKRTFFPLPLVRRVWGMRHILHRLSGDWVLVSSSYNSISHLTCVDCLPFPVFLPVSCPPASGITSKQTPCTHILVPGWENPS